MRPTISVRSPRDPTRLRDAPPRRWFAGRRGGSCSARRCLVLEDGRRLARRRTAAAEREREDDDADPEHSGEAAADEGTDGDPTDRRKGRGSGDVDIDYTRAVGVH